MPTEYLDPVSNDVQWLPQVKDSYLIPTCALGNTIKLLPPVDTSQEYPVLVDPGVSESSTSGSQKINHLAGPDSKISPSSSQKCSGTGIFVNDQEDEVLYI